MSNFNPPPGPPGPTSLGRRSTSAGGGGTGTTSSSSSSSLLRGHSRTSSLPIVGHHRTTSLGGISSSPTSSSSSSLPPPPNVTSNKGHRSSLSAISSSSSSSAAAQHSGGNNNNTQYAQNLARSMTIDEMRALHKRALGEAEAKQTELRLVLASRYRELVGSSDEVTKMRERAQELHNLVTALPSLMERLIVSSSAASSASAQENNNTKKDGPNASSGGGGEEEEEAKSEEHAAAAANAASSVTAEEEAVQLLRYKLARLPRTVHRALDRNDVHEATVALMELFRLVAEQTDEYPLATTLANQQQGGGVMTMTTTTTTNRPSLTVTNETLRTLLQVQIRMTFLHVQTLPSRVVKIAKHILDSASSYGDDVDPKYGAQTSASALAALDLLEIHNGSGPIDGPNDDHRPPQPRRDRPVELLDLYFDSKARLLQSLLSQLNTSTGNAQQQPTGTSNSNDGDEETKDGTGSNNNNSSNNATTTNNAEEILSKIVLILQYDIVLHPYQIFVLRKFPLMPSSGGLSGRSSSTGTGQVDVMKSLPMFPGPLVLARASNFLAAHLPLIRTKVKSVLVDIAGTTASALGKIRQSLYDKTDGIECMERLDGSTGGTCTWEEAVMGVVDVQRVLLSSNSGSGVTTTASSYDSSGTTAAAVAASPSSDGATQYHNRKFSLWGVLFSNTFSSLVHSLLTSSFHSVHTKVVSTLRLSLANAPPLSSILPHEAYRNTLHIASELDAALLRVSEDAHELLVHAEEREESERRLRQSLYVQTCEIMGRLICELRRMLLPTESSYHHDDAVKELIVGRLCHLLKFRLTALPTLLDPNSSPAVLHGTTAGMISLTELSSAFDLADDNDDGLITFQEAMEAVDSAFSGTPFHGAEMVRETLLLPAASSSGVGAEKDNTRSLLLQASDNMNRAVTPQDVTLNELTLLLARGLRHETSGGRSALGTIQDSLDNMMASCFDKWAKDALLPHTSSLSTHVRAFVEMACTSSEGEYQRMYTPSSEVAVSTISTPTGPVVSNVSSHVISFLIDVSFTLNRSLCPSDSLLPVPSVEYALAMGVGGSEIPRMMDIIRWSLLSQGLAAVTDVFNEHAGTALQRSESPSMRDSGPSGIAQLKNDLSFLQTCFFGRNQYGFGGRGSEESAKAVLVSMIKSTDILVRKVCDMNTIRQIESKHEYVLEVCDLFLSSLFGESTSTAAVSLGDMGGSFGAAPRTDSTPLFNGPLASSCRFPLLPIQADRTLSGVQARGKYKDKEESDNRTETGGSGAVLPGFGFFSSMLKKS